MPPRLALTLLAWAVALVAQPVEGFHVMDAVVAAGHGLLLTPNIRLRTSGRFSQLAQVRAGVTAAQSVGHGIELVAAGYYEPTVQSPRFLDSYRAQLGGQMRVALSPKLSLQPRVLWERLNRTTGLAYRRVRAGGRLTWTRGSLSPYLYSDTMAIRGGFHSSRTGAGIGWAAREHFRVEFEYFYDVRQSFWGGDRQVLTTRFQFRQGNQR